VSEEKCYLFQVLFNFNKKRLDRVCTQINYDEEQKKWNFYNHYGDNYGCTPVLINNKHYWPIEIYKDLVVESDDENYEIPIDFSDLHILIRNANDPLIYARNVTRNTMNFYTYFKPNKYLIIGLGGIYFYIGFIIFGFLISFCTCSVCCIFSFNVNLRKIYIFDEMRDEQNIMLNWNEEKKVSYGIEYLFPKSKSSILDDDFDDD
jgi:hypothetical protein